MMGPFYKRSEINLLHYEIGFDRDIAPDGYTKATGWIFCYSDPIEIH